MKLILIVLGVILLIVAGVYFTMPADQLPGFLPGHEAGVTRVHTKHGIVAAVADRSRLVDRAKVRALLRTRQGRANRRPPNFQTCRDLQQLSPYLRDT